MADFQKLGAQVIGISADSVQTLIDFQSKTPAPQQFVSDPDHTVIEAYGVAVGTGSATVAKRQTFVIGKDGKVLFTYFDWSPLTNVNTTLQWLQQHPQN